MEDDAALEGRVLTRLQGVTDEGFLPRLKDHRGVLAAPSEDAGLHVLQPGEEALGTRGVPPGKDGVVVGPYGPLALIGGQG